MTQSGTSDTGRRVGDTEPGPQSGDSVRPGDSESGELVTQNQGLSQVTQSGPGDSESGELVTQS